MDEQLPFKKSREQLEGDKDRALELLPLARKLLYRTRLVASTAQVPVFALTRRQPDGSTIHASTIDGVDRIRIVGAKSGADKQEREEEFGKPEKIVIHIQVRVGGTSAPGLVPPYTGGVWYVIETDETLKRGKVVSTSAGDPHYDYFFGNAYLRSNSVLTPTASTTPSVPAFSSLQATTTIPPAVMRPYQVVPAWQHTLTVEFAPGVVDHGGYTTTAVPAATTREGFAVTPPVTGVPSKRTIEAWSLAVAVQNVQNIGSGGGVYVPELGGPYWGDYYCTAVVTWRATIIYSVDQADPVRFWRFLAGGAGGRRYSYRAPGSVQGPYTATSTSLHYSLPQLQGSSESPAYPGIDYPDHVVSDGRLYTDPTYIRPGDSWSRTPASPPPKILEGGAFAVMEGLGGPQLAAADFATFVSKCFSMSPLGYTYPTDPTFVPYEPGLVSQINGLSGAAGPDFAFSCHAQNISGQDVFAVYAPGAASPKSVTLRPAGTYLGHFAFKEGIVSATQDGAGLWSFHFQKHGVGAPVVTKELNEILPPELYGAMPVQFQLRKFHAAYERFVGRTKD